ncbi:MAG: insulinase family protein [Holosporaceae bacterium]|nr:insulinase family protein [Holosporaceae bacterium]
MNQKQKTIVSIVAAVVIVGAVLWIKGFRHFSEPVSIKNGLSVRTSLIRVKNNSVLYVKCRFRDAGVLQNSADKRGISAVLGLLMFRKINGLSPEETKEKLLELGLKHFSLHTFEDDFEISFQCLEDKAPEAMRFLSAAFRRPEFTKNDLEFAKGAFPNLLEVDVSSPQELVLEKLMALLYPSHSYGLSNTGTDQAISSITFDDVDGFMKTHFSRDNLEVLFVGNVSRFDVRRYLDALLTELPAANSPQPAAEINQELSEEEASVINKQNMEDVVGIMTGVRIDHLTDAERAALHMLIDTLYDEKIGDFPSGLRSRNIANSVGHFFLRRSLSNVFCFFVFVEKKDLEKYLEYLEEKSNQYRGMTDFGKLEMAKDYFMAQFHTGFADLSDVEEHRRINALPFSRVNGRTLARVLLKLFDPSKTRRVIIGNAVKPSTRTLP